MLSWLEGWNGDKIKLLGAMVTLLAHVEPDDLLDFRVREAPACHSCSDLIPSTMQMWTEFVLRLCLLRRIHLLQALYNTFATSRTGYLSLRGWCLVSLWCSGFAD